MSDREAPAEHLPTTTEEAMDEETPEEGFVEESAYTLADAVPEHDSRSRDVEPGEKALADVGAHADRRGRPRLAQEPPESKEPDSDNPDFDNPASDYPGADDITGR